jgi:hypothetical protein
VRTRFTLAFGLLALVAVIASALVTLHVGSRGAEAEAGRRLTTAASFANTLLSAERDRNRSDAIEVASRVTLQQAVATRDSATLARVLAGLRPTLRDDMLAVYAADGSLLASDMLPELRLDEPPGLVRSALGGSAGAATVVLSGHLMLAAAAPILVNNETAGAVLAADTLDERYARRLAAMTELMVAFSLENGPAVATEPLTGALLAAEHWAALRNRGDVRLTLTTTAQPQRALARALLGADNRPVGAMVVAVEEARLTPIEPADLPLYLALSGGVLLGLWIVGAIAAWGLARRAPWREARLPSGATLALAAPALRPLAANGAAANGHASEVRALPHITVDKIRHRVVVDGREVSLTPTEFGLLWALADEPGRVITRESLLEQVRGADWQAEPGLLDTHMSNLRRKIEPDPAHPRYVLTVRGVGYRLGEP